MTDPITIAGCYYFAVGGGKDFVAYNADSFALTNEEVTSPDLLELEIESASPVINQIRSEVWSSGCRWAFVFQREGIYLLHVYDDTVWLCRKHSSRFIEMYLGGSKQ